jgi:two-component system, LytTR family, response regulator
MTATTRRRAFVVGDELLAVQRLIRLLHDTDRVEVVGSATDPREALEALARTAIDILFLDIQMPGLAGFELLDRLTAPPIVIFTTAYDQHTLQALDTNSIDYVLNPIEPTRLQRALDKIDRLAPPRAGDVHKTLQNIARALSAPLPRFPGRVASKVGDRTQWINVSRVSHFYVEGDRTYAATSPRPVRIEATLGELEARLDPRRFLRIHRATLVNLSYVAQVRSPIGGASVTLKDERGTELPVARNRLKTLKENLGS